MTTNTQEIIDLEHEYVLHTYNRPDFVITGGEGSWLFDSEGNKYLMVPPALPLARWAITTLVWFKPSKKPAPNPCIFLTSTIMNL